MPPGLPVRVDSAPTMSQYPQPYPPSPAPYPPYGGIPYAGPYAGLPDPLSAGRRAGVLMFVTGGLLLLLGVCNAGFAAVLSSAQFQAQLQQQQATMGQAGGAAMPFGGGTARALNAAFGLVMVAAGGTLVGLAVGVRRGGRRSTVAGLTLTAVIGAIVGLLLILSLLMGVQAPPMLLTACVLVIPAGLAVLQTVWLTGAVRGLSRVTAGRDQLAAQYWHYQQQMQAYAGTPGYPPYGQGGGYGYAAQPPQLPPGPVPPPIDPA